MAGAIISQSHLSHQVGADVFEDGDRIGVIGEEEQIRAAQAMVDGMPEVL